ncbi:MAG: restriction endonuclease, partial [Gammaproteobacteria bacterium]|nr:restriction endonuclease [Gammaproteobacteria bacterium]
MTKQQLPTRENLLWPTLKALELLGGSASIYE